MKKTDFIHLASFLAIFISLFTACKKNNELTTPFKKDIFNGYVQKGPFVNGSSVTIAELNENLNQTGRIYQTTISDNLGSFEQKNIELISQYVELKAEGYYFSEITGKTSDATLTLYALADIKNINSVNVNVLTHLEKPRIEYLIKQQGLNFAAAKKQAQDEILAIFGFQPQETSSESMNLTNNAVLLAISCILQSNLSTGDMIQLMADIITDIKQDGKLNISLGWRLLHNAYNISPEQIRSNLVKKYTELGMNITIPDFENYIVLFLNSELYPPTAPITYPAKGLYGDNILPSEVTEIYLYRSLNSYFSVTADVPKGANLKIVLNRSYSMQENNWTKNQYPIGSNVYENYTEYTVTEPGKISNLELFIPFNYPLVGKPDSLTIQYYENGASTPKIKTIKITNIDDVDG